MRHLRRPNPIFRYDLVESTDRFPLTHQWTGDTPQKGNDLIALRIAAARPTCAGMSAAMGMPHPQVTYNQREDVRLMNLLEETND